MNSVQRKTGLVLSGGGARGFAHLGVLQAIHEHNISINQISGVSAGAIAAVFEAAGYKPFEVLKILTARSLSKYLKLARPYMGFVKNIELFKLLRKHLPEHLEDLQIPVIIAATNLNTGRIEYFSSGQLARIVLASTSIPVLFYPVAIKKNLYADGGIMNNFPIEPLLSSCNFIIGSHVNPISTTNDLGSLLKITERCIDLTVNESIFEKSKHCHIFIEPAEIAGYKIFDLKKAEKLFDIGYQAACKELKQFLYNQVS